MTTPAAFCPQCGTRRLPDARFCGGCGVDFKAPEAARAVAAPVPAPPLVEAAERPAAPPGPLAPPARPPAPRRRTGLVLGVVAAVLVVVVAAGALLLLRAGGQPAVGPAGSPFDQPIALTSPPPSPGPQLGDPNTPAYQEDAGFTPDAVRVITVTVLQVSLEQYRDVMGAYPESLAELFPTYAPAGPDGRPMTGPPRPADGYTYTQFGSTYNLSVVLADGSTYTVTAPVAP